MSETRYLDGKHAIITGGGRGIGAAIAEELARLGAQLSLMGREMTSLTKTAQALQEKFQGKVETYPCDVSDRGSVERAFAAAQQRLGAAHVLVNNAGQAKGRSFAETDDKLWQRMMNVNLMGAFYCTQQVLPAMVQSRTGRVVNIASTAGLKGYSHVAAYCAAKHGMIGLTRALAIEFAKSGVTINAVCPGYVETEMTRGTVRELMSKMSKSESEARQMLERTMPRGQLVQPKEVANAVAWLCSPDAGAITGQSIAVAGGEVM